MRDFFDEVNALVNDIINHNIDINQTQERIKELKKRYGEDSFPSINFEKKPKPWNSTYLKELIRKNVTGACSEEFILHMAEVSDDINAKNKKTVSIAIAAVVVLLVLIIIFVTTK